MNAKNLIITANAKNVASKTSHIKLISAISAFGLLTSQSVFAADGTSSSGIPGWVWLLLIVAILIGITLLPKKWIEPTQAKNLEKKAPPQAPTPTAPTAKITETAAEIKPAAPKVEIAPVAEKPVEKPLETIKKTPQAEQPIEVDALAEAKQLTVQQRFPQAVGVLNKGLQKNPTRSDLMLELLTIYLKQNDHEAFDAQFEKLKQLDDPIALIQAEELHDQLERPLVVEDSDLIEFDEKKAQIVVSEPEPETVTHDYAADSLTFTSETPKMAELEHLEPQSLDAESVSLGKTVDITPIETEFSLDDFNFEQAAVETKEAPVEVAAKTPSDDFDFSDFDDFDDFVISAPSINKAPDKEAETKEIPPINLAPKEVEPLVPAVEVAEIKAPAAETSKTSDLVDLEFDLDDTFSIDEDKVETSAKKSDWSTDLADETFTSPTEPAFKDPFATEIPPEPVVPAPVAPPKVVEPVAKDLATTLEEEFPFLQTADTYQTRLDLARNYIALGEISSAKELLNEVAAQGAGTQQTEARELIAKLAS